MVINKFYVKYFIICIFLFLIFHLFINTGSDLAMVGFYFQVLSLIILSISGMVAIQNFSIQMDDKIKNKRFQYINNAQQKMNEIDKTFMSNPYLQRLYLDMYRNDAEARTMRKKINDKAITPDVYIAERNMANIIFQTICDIYFIEELHDINKDNVEWFNIFKNWMSSPLLRKYWRSLKFEYHPDIVYFFDEVLLNNKYDIYIHNSKPTITNKITETIGI